MPGNASDPSSFGLVSRDSSSGQGACLRESFALRNARHGHPHNALSLRLAALSTEVAIVSQKLTDLTQEFATLDAKIKDVRDKVTRFYDGITDTAKRTREKEKTATEPATAQPQIVIAGDVDYAGGKWLTGKHRVNVRAEPSSNSPVILTVERGQELIEVSRLGEWILVDGPIAGLRGWVYAPLLHSVRTVPNVRVTSYVLGRPLWVNAASVRIRTGAGTQFDVIRQLSPGTKVLELSRTHNWVEVEVPNNGLTGWVFEWLLNVEPASVTHGAPGIDRWVVMDNYAQIKSAPEGSATIVGKLKRGQEVVPVALQDGWLRVPVRGSNARGWIHTAGLELSTTLAAGAAAFIRHLSEPRKTSR